MTPEQIARGLTKAQRELLDLFDTNDDAVFVSTTDASQLEAVDQLYNAGMVAKVRAAGMNFITLEPVGIAVRAELERIADE